MKPAAKKRNQASWQIIYMDLMTIIMVFFVILWSINSGKDDGISPTLGNETKQMVDLPGDVLFKPGKWQMTSGGQDVFKSLFSNAGKSTLSFQGNALTKRLLVINGHTDGDGVKGENMELGYRRALSAYREISKYSKELRDHVVICTHTDNSPEQEVPKFSGKISKAQRQALREAKSKNRRITIEDKLVERNIQ